MIGKPLTKADLTEDQLAALNYMIDFIHAPKGRQMVLCGAAGTGKTSVVNVLLDELDKEQDSPVYVCTATTNKAVEVIAKRTMRDFDSTIYSILGLVLQDFDDRKAKLAKVNDGHLDEYELVIIDEASMVSTELLGEIERQLRVFTATKVIYIGDICQIPPVSDANNGLLESAVFQLPKKVTLTKVMRTAEDNPILGVVTAMRSDMKSPTDLYEHNTLVSPDGTGIFFYDKFNPFFEKMIGYFTDDRYKADSNYAMAVAWTNEAIDEINLRVRNVLYPGNDMYSVGEEVSVASTFGVDTHVGKNGKGGVIYKPIYSIEERLRIESVSRVKDPLYGIDCYKMKVVNHRASRRNKIHYEAYVVSEEGEEAYIKLKEELSIKAKEKLEIKARNGQNLYTPKEAWKDYSEFKHYYLKLKYVYAMTTHKAQGSTIENVFVIERNMNRISEDEYRNKLKYTAFTRASKELHILT